MTSTIDLCEKYFGKRDIYEVLEIPKDAAPNTIKKAYYKISLQVHPDRVSEEQKAEATEKFKILSKVYQILTDKEKRALFDERGIVDDDDDEMVDSKLMNWLELWRKLFQPLTLDAITKYEQSYVDSELERADIKKSYLSTKGNINLMINQVPFIKLEDEPRLQKIVREMIDANEVPEYKAFTEENAAKRKRRHQKYERESKVAAKLKDKHLKKMAERQTSAETETATGNDDDDDDDDLATALCERSRARAGNFDTLMDKLAEKYGGVDDSETIDFNSMGKKRTSGKKKQAKKELRTVKSGKVEKRKN